MNPFDFHQAQTRRQMIGLGARGLGALGAASLLNPALLNAATTQASDGFAGTLGQTSLQTHRKTGYLLILIRWTVAY
jgi:hypothetical protein